MHLEVQQWFDYVKSRYPENFDNCLVAECGSLNINGSLRSYFTKCFYDGVDIGPGPGVDIVSKFHEANLPIGSYNTTISSECFEHCAEWKESFQRMYDLLKPGGLLVFTCASTGRVEHGTTQSEPGSSPFTNDYYHNLTEAEFKEWFDFDNLFESYRFDTLGTDLRFYGVKNK